MTTSFYHGNDIGTVWSTLLRDLYTRGENIEAHGTVTRELTNVVLYVDNAHNNILLSPTRNLNHKFMVAEWLYIWFGHCDVETIAFYNSRMRQFSDDGITLAGAYGPPVREQWHSMRDKLYDDVASRQGIIQIYSPPEPNSKDVPCTLALQFFIRRGLLHTTAFMRSSDVWLGVPYDIFTFTMLGNILAGQLGMRLGPFTLHIGSSHLYERDVDPAKHVIQQDDISFAATPQLPGEPPNELDYALIQEGHAPVEEPWSHYARILAAPRGDALTVLYTMMFS